jgi:hypothetical protein
MNTPDRLAQKVSNREDGQLREVLLLLQRDRVCDDYFLKQSA